jgi:hypothetical protein
MGYTGTVMSGDCMAGRVAGAGRGSGSWRKGATGWADGTRGGKMQREWDDGARRMNL